MHSAADTLEQASEGIKDFAVACSFDVEGASIDECCGRIPSVGGPAYFAPRLGASDAAAFVAQMMRSPVGPVFDNCLYGTIGVAQCETWRGRRWR